MSVFQLHNGYPMNVHEIKEFAKGLTTLGIPFQERGHWLEVGECALLNDYTIYISVLSHEMEALLQRVLPVLEWQRVSYRLLKNAQLVDQCNGLSLGAKEAGKVIIIYPENVQQTKLLARELEAVTNHFKGIMPYDCLRIGKVLYTSLQTGINFRIPAAYKVRRRKGIIGRYYVPIQLLRFNPKGDVQLGVNLKRFSFSHCIIKQARGGSFVDRHGREAAHKLFWQKSVLEAVQDHLPVPRVIDYCCKGEDNYLITEYIDGVGLLEQVQQIYAQHSWSGLTVSSKRKLLDYFLQVTASIKRLHELGYLHRDIQINNFIIRKEQVYVLDFELAWYMPAGMPDPPFGFGTLVFMSPQQAKGDEPAPADDIYSLGVLLAFMLLNPMDHQSFSGNIYNALVNAGVESHLLEMVINCLDPDPNNRPTISSMITLLETGKIPENIELV